MVCSLPRALVVCISTTQISDKLSFTWLRPARLCLPDTPYAPYATRLVPMSHIVWRLARGIRRLTCGDVAVHPRFSL